METLFSVTLRAAVTSSGHSLGTVSEQLRARGTPLSVSTLSSWQTGQNYPERAGSIAALANVEAVLGLRPRALVGLLPGRRPRGRRQSEIANGANGAAVRETPQAVVRVLAKLDASPDELQSPTRLSRSVRVRVDAGGAQSEIRSRQVVVGNRHRVERVIALVRHHQWPCAPHVFGTEGCRLGRIRADRSNALCAFELLLDKPLGMGELGMIEFGTRFPGGRPDNQHAVRIAPGARDLTLHVSFDPRLRPARCVGFHRAGPGERVDVLVERAGSEVGPTFQLLALDPQPGVYGIRWDWPPR